MKKYSFLLFIAISFCINMAVAQNVGENNQKYWYYRERLKWFMIGIGPNAGYSIPCPRRGESQFPKPPNVGELGSDDCLNWLGLYIGTLATEWKLLHDEGSDTRNTTTYQIYLPPPKLKKMA